MTPKQLAEIEERLNLGCSGHDTGDGYTEVCSCFEDDAWDLLSEVKHQRSLLITLGIIARPSTATGSSGHGGGE